MSRLLYSWVRSHLQCIRLLFAFFVFGGGVAHAACYGTPSAAIEAVKTGFSLSAVAGSGGYYLTGIRSDPVLGDRWAMVGRCDHPDWPSRVIRIQGPGTPAMRLSTTIQADDAHVAPVVRAGEIVRVWRQEDLLRIEVSAVSEQSGGLGKTIRLRFLRRDTEEASTQQEISGIVRGPSNVEMQP